MSLTTEQEILKNLPKFKAKKKDSPEQHRRRLAIAMNNEADDAWAKISEETQAWVNDAVTADDSGEPIPVFPEDVEEEETAAAETPADPEPAKEEVPAEEAKVETKKEKKARKKAEKKAKKAKAAAEEAAGADSEETAAAETPADPEPAAESSKKDKKTKKATKKTMSRNSRQTRARSAKAAQATSATGALMIKCLENPDEEFFKIYDQLIQDGFTIAETSARSRYNDNMRMVRTAREMGKWKD